MWILYAFASLLFLNARNVVTKFNVSNTHEYVSMWYTFVFQIPLGVVAVLFSGIVINDPKFFIFVLIRVILDIIAFVFFFKSLKIAEISAVLPFMSLLPALTVFTSFVINGQNIHPLRLLIIVAIVVCCYVLYRFNTNGTAIKRSNLRGIVYMLIVIGIYSILDPLHAEIIKLSAPFTYFFISSLYFITIWTVFVLVSYRKELFSSFRNKKQILLNGANGVVLSLEVLSLFLALVPGSITAIVTAIRSTNVAVSSVLGGLLFSERLNKLKVLLILIITVLILLLVLI